MKGIYYINRSMQYNSVRPPGLASKTTNFVTFFIRPMHNNIEHVYGKEIAISISCVVTLLQMELQNATRTTWTLRQTTMQININFERAIKSSILQTYSNVSHISQVSLQCNIQSFSDILIINPVQFDWHIMSNLLVFFLLSLSFMCDF